MTKTHADEDGHGGEDGGEISSSVHVREVPTCTCTCTSKKIMIVVGYFVVAIASFFIGAFALRQITRKEHGLRLRVMPNYNLDWQDAGAVGSKTYRRFFVDKSGKRISPWHDLPLGTEDDVVKLMVTEIPKMTQAKMEIATDEAHNPIAQDMKNGELRDYHGPIYWNYGFMPQTWEDPAVGHPGIQALGDNDPLDVVEIGSRTHQQGEVSKVKVLGALAMIDSGELDWKIIAIDVNDPDAGKLHTIADLDSLKPEFVPGIREWFRWYKTPDNKPLNKFGFNGKAIDSAEALDVVRETHEAWKRLRSGSSDAKGLWTSVKG